jgi:hypothetical protein
MGKSSINGPFSMAMLNNQRITHFDGRITEFKPLNGDLLGLRKSGTNIY